MTEIMTIEQYKAARFQDEFALQVAICDWLRDNYPAVPFQSDWSGIRLTTGQAVKLNRVKYGRGWPDLFVAYPAHGFHGAYLELKLSVDDYRRQDGQLRQTQHIQEQNDTLFKLRCLGYWAYFVGGYEEAIRTLEWYLTGVG